MRFTPARPGKAFVLASFAHSCLFLSSSVSKHANVKALPVASSTLLADAGDSLASESTFLGFFNDAAIGALLAIHAGGVQVAPRPVATILVHHHAWRPIPRSTDPS